MDRKPKVTLVATAPDGDEIRVRTSAGYDWAGIAKHRDGSWLLLAKGWAWYSVKARTRREYIASGDRRAFVTGWYVVPFKPLRKDAE